MKPVYFVFIIALTITNSLFGQNYYYEIEGRVINSETKEPIPYSNIYNKTLQKGTISNQNGYFRISVSGVTDTVSISYIGFKDQIIEFKENFNFYSIRLEVNTFLLDEVTITPKDNSYLYELVQKCRKSASVIELKSKAYYELKSFIDNNKIELVEGYYNVDICGYTIKDLHLKAGRVVLQPYEDRFFASLESSRAIIMLNLLNGNEYFPVNPLELSKSRLKNSFYLTLDNKYLDNEIDSIYVIDYKAKDTTGLFFEGKLWISKTKYQILKITLNCKNALKYPFMALFSSDKISNVSFNITQTFNSVNNEAQFKHIDFIYRIDYKSRIGKIEERNYSVTTRAVLYVYDYNDTFFQPIFDFNKSSIGDYRKINAFPYNHFFWSNNNEYRLNDTINTFELFSSGNNTLTNKTLFKPNSFLKSGLFEHPYVAWSKRRVKFTEILPDSIEQSKSTDFIADKYKLAVKIYLDVNSNNDSTYIGTSTIFDPFDSYYYLPIDNKTQCFINIYFDLCEIKRLELEEKLRAEKQDSDHVLEIYNEFIKEFNVENKKYLEAVQRGTNEKEMKRYNDYVYNKLGINNISLFQAFNNQQ